MAKTPIENKTTDSIRNELPWPIRSRVILEDHRLHAQDLLSSPAGRQNALRTRITNVSLEGLEELSVLLHLEGISKPLRLTKEQRAQMATMLQSNNYADWVDQWLALTVSKSASPHGVQRLDGNDIELSLTADPATLSSKSGTRLPQPSVILPAQVGSHTGESATAEGASAGVSEQPPASPDASQSRIPHTHFSGSGEEYSMPDPSAELRSRRSRGSGFTLPHWMRNNWMRNIGHSALLKQVSVLLGPNFWVALLLFMLVVAVVQFERIVAFFALLWA